MSSPDTDKTIQNEPVAAWATDCRDKYPENHDSGYAGRICMADGNLAWAAVVSDGAGGSMEGLKVSALAVQAFVEAVRKSTLAELSDPAARDAWLRTWTKSLHADASARFKGGMATFCGAVILPPSADGTDWRLFTLNVGDSQVLKLDGSGRCMGVTPDAPPNNANVEGHNPVRVVGVAPKGDFCLLDVEEFPLPKEGPCWILAGSDGFFSKKKGKAELSIFSTGDLRDVCIASGAPFQELPALAIRRSLENARKLDAAEMMDNSTVAMLGFRVPATALKAASAAAAGVPGGASRAGEPQGGAVGERTLPGGSGKSTAARSESAVRRGGSPRLAALAAGIALVVGVVFGALAFGGRGGQTTSADDAHGGDVADKSPADAVSPYPELADRSAIPGKANARCAYCMELLDKGELPKGRTPFHWAEDCIYRPRKH